LKFPAVLQKGSLTLGGTSGASSVSAHGDGFLVVDDVLEVGNSALQLQSVDGLGGLTGVFEADTQVRAPGTGALRGRNRLCGVADLNSQCQFIQTVFRMTGFGLQGVEMA
jgi:hypothetical protein